MKPDPPVTTILEPLMRMGRTYSPKAGEALGSVGAVVGGGPQRNDFRPVGDESGPSLRGAPGPAVRPRAWAGRMCALVARDGLDSQADSRIALRAPAQPRLERQTATSS